MPARELHDTCDLDDVIVGHVLMKQVAHRVYEDHSRRAPLEGLAQLRRNEPEIKPLLVGVAGHPAKTLREGFRIAVGTSGADLGTATDRIPCRIRPLDRRMVAHPGIPLWKVVSP